MPYLEPNKKGRGGVAKTQGVGKEEVEAILKKPEEAAQRSEEAVYQQVQGRNGGRRITQAQSLIGHSPRGREVARQKRTQHAKQEIDQ